MYCPKCGNELPDESYFCDNCGFQQQKSNDKTGNAEVLNGRGAQTNGCKKGSKGIAVIVSIIIAVVAVIAVIVIFLQWKAGVQKEAVIQVVRNGYLGEYTDVTVQGLLEATFHTAEGASEINWECSQDENEKWNVVASCNFDGSNIATFCFQLLEENTFLISDIKCTYLDVSTIENKALELNRMYFTYYLDPNSLGVLVERLSEVQFGAVLCGMTTEYDGDIRDIFKQNYPEMENLSVAQALGLITEREVEDYAGTYYFPVDSFGDGTYVDFLDIEPVGLDQLHIRRQSYRITIFDVYTDLPENDVITLYDENGMRVDIIYHFDLGAVQIETADTEDSLGISGWYYLNPESVSTETDLNVDYSWIEGKYHQAHYAPMTLELWFDSEAPWEYGNDWYVCYNIHDDYEILRDGLAYYMGGGEKPTFYGGNPYSPGSEIQFDYDGYNFVLTSEDGAFDGTSFFLE